MKKKVTHVCYADNDINEQYLFSRALDGMSNKRTLKTVYSCTLLMAYLDDTNQALPDMIFLNHNIKNNTAQDCLKQIKSNSRLLDIPIVMYSNSHRNSELKTIKEAGIFKYIVKPLDLYDARAVLLQVINEYENGLPW